MDRRLVYGAALIGIVGAGVYLGWRNSQHSDNSEQISIPKSASSLATPTLGATETPTITPTEISSTGTTTINRRGVLYDVTADPEGRDRQCIKLRVYVDGNKQDVDGAAVALGSDTEAYIDILGGDIYSADGIKIGSFDRSALPDSKKYWIEPPGTIVCANIDLPQ